MQRLFFTAFVAVLFASCSRTETARPQRKDITEVIFANGELYKSAEYVATANADGFLQWLAVQEGDSVAVGSTIARIGSDIARINLDMARTNYGDAVAKTTDQAPEIQQLAAQIEQARAQAKNDEANCRRLEPLAATHTVSVLDFENAKLKHEASLAQLKVLEKNMAEVRNALALAAKNAGGQLKIQQENLREFRVTAQISGQVLQSYKKQGELVRRGESIALVGGGTDLLKLFVAEEDIGRVKAGQELSVVLNSEPKATYRAVIRDVLPLFDAKNQSYVARAEFVEKPAARLIAGTQLQANILLGTRSNVLVVPAACLIKNDKVVLKAGAETTVQTGQKTGEWVEILSGIDDNAELIVHKKKKVR